MSQSQSSKPTLQYTHSARFRMQELIDQLQTDAAQTEDVRVQVMFETSVEILNGMVKVFTDFEQKYTNTWPEQHGSAKLSK